MYQYFSVAILILALSCTNSQPKKQIEIAGPKEEIKTEFHPILDSANVRGAILIYELQTNTYYSNEYHWAQSGRLPASTFKIPHSIIGLETALLKDDSTIFYWDQKPRTFASWEQDLSLKKAFHYSCVPCYQELARKIGAKRMKKHLAKLNFGEMQVDSSNIDLFWLEGNSKISQFDQIDFLKRFYQDQLPIRARTKEIMSRMMIITQEEDYILRGKTGWASRDGDHNGWFVGYLESKDKTYFFATNIVPKEGLELDKFTAARKEVTLKAIDLLL
ncbi:class D beta-lactamase [Saprospira grandis]|uniref:Beta-lactamase n=1 Tax=Saprospira grandis (strain Lewin) TaxID=984262 RepID=H6L7R6_SAPGL|nr:class D beta-lactamase [Saprospira grandis]AFC23098.1 beta-lactamase [Saprospira grandis str. Lewin]